MWLRVVVSKGEGVGTSNNVDELGDNKTLESLKKHLRQALV